MKFAGKLRSILFFALLGLVAAGLLSYSIWGSKIPINEIRAYLGSSDIAPFLFILFYSGLSVFFPTTPMMAIAGIFFGFWEGFVYSSVAGLISALFMFVLARILGKAFVDRYLESRKSLELIEKYDEKMARHGTLTVMILRIMPIMPFNVLNLIIGISKVSFKDYIVGTIIGLVPSTILAVYFGSLFLTETFRELSLYLGAAIMLGLLAFGYFRLLIVWKYFNKRGSRD
jgi:uncharacterized membrane protein YdjX (TVP38/TMEM64 family)